MSGGEDINTQEKLRALLRSADESRMRSRYSSATNNGTGASRSNTNDYTVPDQKINELADLIGTIEGSTYTTDRVRMNSNRTWTNQSTTSRTSSLRRSHRFAISWSIHSSS